MRIFIDGDCPTARNARTLLSQDGFDVIDSKPALPFTPHYKISIQESSNGVGILFDSVDSALERNVFKATRGFTKTPILTQTEGGVQSQHELRITVSSKDEDREAVALGILHGLHETVNRKKKRKRFGLLFGLLLIASPAYAQNPSASQNVDVKKIGGTSVPSGVVDAVNSAIKVNCVTGCAGGGGGGAATIADGADVTQGAIADVGVTTDTNGTQSAKLRGLVKMFADVWDAGNHRFKVNVENASLPVIGTFWPVTQPVSIASMPSTPVTGTFWQATQPVSGTFWQATQPISGTVTVNAGTNLNTSALALDATLTGGTQKTKIVDTGGTNVASVSVAGAVKVDGSAVTQPVSGTVTTTPPANASTNVAQLNGTTTDTNSGVKSAGTLRVVLATDQPALTNKLLVTPDSVALPANQSVNLNQIAGSTILTAATGSQKVGVTGNAGAAFDAANNAAAPANVVVDGFETATQTSTQPTVATAGNVRRGVISTDGSLYVRPHGPVIWSCGLTAIGTTLTQCQAAPGAGLRLYITDVVSQSNTATAGLFTLRFGTGSNCATGTGNLIFNSASALMASPGNTVAVNHFHLTVPMSVTTANAVCVLGVVTNTTNIQINGYTAP